MNEDLIRRVQDALKYDLREMDAVFTPLLNDVLAELTKTPTKTPKAKPVSLMIALGEPGKSPSTADVVADARARMEANPLPCIAKAIEADLRNGTLKATAPTEPTTRTFMVTVNWRGSMHVDPMRTFVVESEARDYAKTLTGGTPVLYETFTTKPPKKLKV